MHHSAHPLTTTHATVPLPTSVATETATPSPTEPAPTPSTFTFDVENRAAVGVVVSVVSDYGATMPGFLPGQRGSVVIWLLNPRNGIGVEIQDGKCGLLASAQYPTPEPFTLLIDDGSKSGEIRLSTRKGASATAVPLPSNSLQGCGG